MPFVISIYLLPDCCLEEHQYNPEILNDLNDLDLNDRISLCPLSHAARYSERSSDSGQNADGYLKNCFPGVCFHLLMFNV